MIFAPNLTQKEHKTGLIALPLCMFLLPVLLALVLPDLSDARLTFTGYFISAAVALYILRGFLLRDLKCALSHPFPTFYYGCLGCLGCLALSRIVDILLLLLAPGFVNLNNASIETQLGNELQLMLVTTIVLAPIVEECLFRGLLLRGFYDRSPALAWALSVGLFAACHVVGFIGVYSPLELVLAFIQYLPGGIALCVAYQRGGSIFSPIVGHAIINLMAAYNVTR